MVASEPAPVTPRGLVPVAVGACRSASMKVGKWGHTPEEVPRSGRGPAPHGTQEASGGGGGCPMGSCSCCRSTMR